MSSIQLLTGSVSRLTLSREAAKKLAWIPSEHMFISLNVYEELGCYIEFLVFLHFAYRKIYSTCIQFDSDRWATENHLFTWNARTSAFPAFTQQFQLGN